MRSGLKLMTRNKFYLKACICVVSQHIKMITISMPLNPYHTTELRLRNPRCHPQRVCECACACPSVTNNQALCTALMSPMHE